MAAALPRYDIGEELGRGAWGVVYAAHHRDLRREVAVKRLPPAFAADTDVRDRFRAEARLVASLNHPHILAVHDFVEHDDICLLVMERLDGGSLWDRFVTQGRSMQASCAATLATCAALSYAHGLGVLHRDIKPQNLLYSKDGTLKVADFGIAKVLGGSQTMATVAGQVLGTPTYISPEQAVGDHLGPATDVYAIGTVLYELLSGRLPFTPRDTALATLYAHAHQDPIPLSDVAPQVPAPLAACAMRAIEREQSSRYPTAEAFGIDLAKASNEVWDTGWLGRSDLVVVPSSTVAHHLSLPPQLRPDPPAPEAIVHPSRALADGGATRGPDQVRPTELTPLPNMLAAAPPPPAASAPPRPGPHHPPPPSLPSTSSPPPFGPQAAAAAPYRPPFPTGPQPAAPSRPPHPTGPQPAAPYRPPPPRLQPSAPYTPPPTGPQPAAPPWGSPTMPTRPRTNTLALVSLLSSTVLSLFCIGSIIGPITGHLARKEIRGSGGAQTGDGLALAGIIIGYVTLALWIVYLIAASAAEGR